MTRLDYSSDLEKLSNIGWILITGLRKWTKVWQTLSRTLARVHSILTKFFLVLNFQFYRNFISLHLVNDQNLLLHTNIADTYLKGDRNVLNSKSDYAIKFLFLQVSHESLSKQGYNWKYFNWTENNYWSGGLSTVDILIKIACFLKRKNIFTSKVSNLN
jgi:hypothetical protein